uniref:C-type lectin domain-containing protein n=2 Tax=Magallana gigas TaxID=29159 RepID=A0A8W8M7T5_MAGGI
MSASEYLEMKLKTDANYQNVIPLDISYDIDITGWFPFNGHCYSFVETKFNSVNAQKSCMKNGSYLIEIGSESENKWVVDFFVRSKLPEKCAEYMECAFWIGFTDQALEGTFSWKHNNVNSEYTNWGTNEPNNGGDEDCAVFKAPSIFYEWNDDKCPKLMMSVCEMDTNM